VPARRHAPAVSRRFVEATEHVLAELLAGDLSKLDLVALMIDGVHFGDHVCVVAMGINIAGRKHPLSITEGDTGERDRREGPPRRTSRSRTRGDKADPRRHRRRKGPRKRPP